jgi:hypothetical protein
LLKELPTHIIKNGIEYELIIKKYDDAYGLFYRDNGSTDFKDSIGNFEDKKLPNALAKCWLYLKKNGLLK